MGKLTVPAHLHLVIQTMIILFCFLQSAFGQQPAPGPASKTSAWQEFVKAVEQLEPVLFMLVALGVVVAVILVAIVFRNFPNRLFEAVRQGIMGMFHDINFTQLAKTSVETLTQEIGIKEQINRLQEKLDDFSRGLLTVLKEKPIIISPSGAGTAPSFSTGPRVIGGSHAESLVIAEHYLNCGNYNGAKDICIDILKAIIRR